MARKLKIYEQSLSGPNYKPVPTIILKGQWLKDAGFDCGEYVEVICEGNKITITKTTPPEPSTKIALEEKIKQLSTKQRKKLSEMIDKF